MQKYIKLKRLCIAVIADNVGNEEWKIRENLIPVYPKYFFWNPGYIKYFVSAIDKTKYPLITNGHKMFDSKPDASVGVVHYCSFNSLCVGAENHSRLRSDKVCELLKSTMAKKIIGEVKELYNTKKGDLNITPNHIQKSLSDASVSYKHNIGYNLMDSKIYNEPAIGRDDIVNAIIETLVQPEGNPVLVGNKGVGKTAIVRELAYRIKNGDVPKVLQGKNIIEVSSNSFVAGTRYRGDFEEKVYSILQSIKNRGDILFIDDIASSVGSGTVEGNNSDLASILKEICEQGNIKIIGVSNTFDYDSIFSNSKLGGLFEPINVKEPNDFLLYQIINHIFERYAIYTGVSIENLDSRITNILAELTNCKNQVYFDRLANPKFVSGIINKAFGIAQIEESKYLTYNHLSKSVKQNDRLYSNAKHTYISRIKELDTVSVKEEKSRVLRLR